VYVWQDFAKPAVAATRVSVTPPYWYALTSEGQALVVIDPVKIPVVVE
jgi:hypothetical protein